jgi:hypothetical protein
MKKAILLTASAVLALSGSAFADVKIKTKQTMSGQSTENTTYIKGKRQRTEMANGVMVSITQCDLGKDLRLAPQTKTYTVSYYADANGNPTTPVSQSSSAPVTKGGIVNITTTIKDTGERKQMFGYTARHIVQTVETESSADACYPSKSKMEMDMWVIDAEFGLACTQNYSSSYNGGKAGGGCKDKIVPKTIGTAKSGYPLYQKMTSFDASGKESYSMIQEVVELSKTTLDQALFEAPADYREVSDASQMYAANSVTSGVSYNGNSSNGVSYSGPSSVLGNQSAGSPQPSALNSSIKNAATPSNVEQPSVGAKKEGAVRVGVIVKTTAAGEGIAAADLSAAVLNSLGQYVKGTKVEIVPIEAKLAQAQVAEAQEKQCNYILLATAAHKKGGGGGFGGFGKMLSSVAPMMGGGSIVGQIATSAIITATSMSGNMKSKDELTLDLKLQSTADNSVALTKQLKVKAKADGEDIISSIIEQAAQAILDTIGK